MKIFVVIPHTFAGCGFYRQYQPHNHLAKQGIDVLLGAGLYDQDDKFCVDADIIHFHKGYLDLNGVRAAKERGIITIGDFDDWWRLDTEHIFYKSYLKDNTTNMLVEFLKEVDYVTVTTELLRAEAVKFNPNVIVLPNAMDMNYPGCYIDRVKEDKFVFGYLGGTCHRKDVEMLRGVSNRTGAFFRLMGFDNSEPCRQYADVLSDSGKGKFDWLKKADIWAYPQFYNCLDVSLVPLVDNKFNSFKSELKLIEAGFFKKGVIVSNVEPYKKLLRHKENCFVVNKPADWVKGVKWYMEDHTRAGRTGEELFKTVQPYSIDRVNEKRLKFYTDVLEKRNINSSIGHSRLQGVH